MDAGHIHDAFAASVQPERQISVFGERLQAQPARLIDCILANGADRARHNGDALPTIVSAPVEIKTTGVFQTLAAPDERSQISNLRMA